jgi:probable HAF family extracellular repeat protein
MRPQFKRNKVNMASVIGVLLVITAVVGPLRQTFGQTTEYTVLELTSGGLPHRLNNSGDVAGSKAESPSGEIRATIWNHGNFRPRNLGKLEGGEYSSASGINNAREVAGAGNIAGSIVPFLWTPGNGFGRIPLLAGDDCGQAVGINRYRHVVKYSSGSTGRKAFLWTWGRSVRNLSPLPGGLWTEASGMQDLGVLSGGNSSQALAINDMGAVVGSSTSSSGDRAFVWTNQAGMRDL